MINRPGHPGDALDKFARFVLTSGPLLLILKVVGNRRSRQAAWEGSREGAEAPGRGPDGRPGSPTTAERTWDWDDVAYPSAVSLPLLRSRKRLAWTCF